MKSIYFPLSIASRLLGDAQASPDVEICGIIAIDGKHNFYCYPVDNISITPNINFEMDPKQLIHCQKTLRDKNQSMVAIYHSHPNGNTQPSTTDIEQHEYYDLLYLIITPGSEGVMSLSGFSINEDTSVHPVILRTV